MLNLTYTTIWGTNTVFSSTNGFPRQQIHPWNLYVKGMSVPWSGERAVRLGSFSRVGSKGWIFAVWQEWTPHHIGGPEGTTGCACVRTCKPTHWFAGALFPVCRFVGGALLGWRGARPPNPPRRSRPPSERPHRPELPPRGHPIV